jgi:hypothetical protein
MPDPNHSKEEMTDMKSIILSLPVVLLFAAIAAAQEVPRIEGSAAYAFSPKPSSFNGDISDGPNRHGWSGSLVGNVDDVFGMEFNASGAYADVPAGKIKIHGFMAGPRFTYREKAKIAPYGRAFMGVVNRSVAGVSDSFLSAQLGGGITVFTGKRFGVVTGADYRRSWRGLKWDDLTVYVGISIRKPSR